jgi:prophage regulatory protein
MSDAPETTTHKGRPPNASAIGQFDQLPDAAFVRVHTVADLFAISPSNVWRWVKAGRLPAPLKLSEQTTAWRVGDLREALAKASTTGAGGHPPPARTWPSRPSRR